MDYKRCNTHKEIESLRKDVDDTHKKSSEYIKKRNAEIKNRLLEIQKLSFWERRKFKKEKEELENENTIKSHFKLLIDNNFFENFERMERLLKACVTCEIKNCPLFNKTPKELCPESWNMVEFFASLGTYLREKEREEYVSDLMFPF